MNTNQENNTNTSSPIIRKLEQLEDGFEKSLQSYVKSKDHVDAETSINYLHHYFKTINHQIDKLGFSESKTIRRLKTVQVSHFRAFINNFEFHDDGVKQCLLDELPRIPRIHLSDNISPKTSPCNDRLQYQHSYTPVRNTQQQQQQHTPLRVDQFDFSTPVKKCSTNGDASNANTWNLNYIEQNIVKPNSMSAEQAMPFVFSAETLVMMT